MQLILIVPFRMQMWNLNTYLYGPKDDLKHRLLWREVYSAEEEAQLKALVCEAVSRGLTFVYALSPGQDIVFSSSWDLTLLKRKLRQVSDLGCQAFALLFDDIDHSMCQSDTEAFSSFAHAQVTVANEIFHFLGEPPVFLFCPTEYCSSLCTPSVSKSPYLLTIGENLLPGISVIWTGNKVISRELSPESLAEVQSVLRRPPLIWDNLHANDYDSRRVFLGPFKGRPPGLRAHLRGLLLNPNCEFEANFIPLHTLGSWYKEGKEEGKGESRMEDRSTGALASDEIPADPVMNQDLKAGENQVSRSFSHEKTPRRGLCSGSVPLSEAQVRLLVGLYYLPHEHGPPAQNLLQDLTWLKANCHCVSVEEWRDRAGRFLAACDDVALLHSAVVNSINRALLYDLYPYIWDLRNTLLVAKAFICWLGERDTSSGAELHGVEAEPWVFKGGLSGEVQEVLLYFHEEQDYPDSLLYHFPSQLRLEALPELVDCSVSRSLLTALLMALKANSSQGVFCEVQPTDGLRIEFLTKLGFLEILRGEARPREGVVLGRLL
uniref:protein O-GlcNAcase n=1 Tax=Sinocyclocheilus anshuiensis TaxID=1608454 RepID=A0A671P8G3_9TELE